jgi:hypothetical protein
MESRQLETHVTGALSNCAIGALLRQCLVQRVRNGRSCGYFGFALVADQMSRLYGTLCQVLLRDSPRERPKTHHTAQAKRTYQFHKFHFLFPDDRRGRYAGDGIIDTYSTNSKGTRTRYPLAGRILEF